MTMMMMKIVTASWHKLCLEIKLASVVKMFFLERYLSFAMPSLFALMMSFFFPILLTELMGIATENKISEETENNRNTDLKKAGNEFKTRQIALTEEPIETAECNAVGTTEKGSDKTKARYHENVNSLEMSPIQTHEGVFQRLTLRDTPSMIQPNSITHKRVPFRVLDCNRKQATCKQTIWRPW